MMMFDVAATGSGPESPEVLAGRSRTIGNCDPVRWDSVRSSCDPARVLLAVLSCGCRVHKEVIVVLCSQLRMLGGDYCG